MNKLFTCYKTNLREKNDFINAILVHLKYSNKSQYKNNRNIQSSFKYAY